VASVAVLCMCGCERFTHYGLQGACLSAKCLAKTKCKEFDVGEIIVTADEQERNPK